MQTNNKNGLVSWKPIPTCGNISEIPNSSTQRDVCHWISHFL